GGVAKRQGDVEEKVGEIGKTVEKTAENVKMLGNQVDAMADHFGKIDQQLEDQKKQQEKTDHALSQVALNVAKAEAAQRGGLDKMGASLEEINKKLAKLHDKPAGGGGAAGKAAPAAVHNAAAPQKPIRIQPGQKVDVIVKNKGFYTGSYIGMTDKSVKVQTIPDPKAPPSEWDIRDVQAFQTRDGIFAFNEDTGQFEPGVTFFRFNKSNASMERIESTQDTYLA